MTVSCRHHAVRDATAPVSARALREREARCTSLQRGPSGGPAPGRLIASASPGTFANSTSVPSDRLRGSPGHSGSGVATTLTRGQCSINTAVSPYPSMTTRRPPRAKSTARCWSHGPGSETTSPSPLLYLRSSFAALAFAEMTRRASTRPRSSANACSRSSKPFSSADLPAGDEHAWLPSKNG